MRTRWIPVSMALAVVMLFTHALSAQEADPADSTGLPGDHFSLEAAIELFKKSDSPEDFEKRLNAEDNHVNNLDLNEDGEVDYIRVVDNMDGDAHALVLQVPVSATESQDIAVIEIEKQGEENAILQIIGNEDIYGEQVIAEPYDEEMPQKGRGGPAPSWMEPERIVVNVWLWPSVRFMYRPGYTVWASPWRWRYYPAWWRPWHPYAWGWYHVRVAPYRVHYHIVPTHRVVHAHAVYVPRRTSSTVVHTRTTTVVTTRKHGTQVTGRRTTTSTTVHGPRGGSVTREKTTTKVRKEGRNDGGGQRNTTKTSHKRGRH